MILAGDIGGTNTRLAIFDSSLALVRRQVYPNQGRASFVEIVHEFLQAAPAGGRPSRAAFGVAGPVSGGHATMTNLAWTLDERSLSSDLGIARVAVINDLVAHAEGIELLTPDQLITIQAGNPVPADHGNRAIIAAGTGLGESGVVWDCGDKCYRAFPSEGGHCDFAPRGTRQTALLGCLAEKYPNASWERVLSGPGLRNIYDFLIHPDQLGPQSALPDPNPSPRDITAQGMRRSNAACAEALDLFVSCYGAESANLALKMLATGGIYLGGGIAPNIAERLNSEAFLEPFLATGPENIRALLRRVPVHIINDEFNGLHGAANYARRL